MRFLFNIDRFCLEGTISDIKIDPEEEMVSSNTGGGEPLLMNNGSRDTSHSDIQKLQQQLQDIKEQVRAFFATRFVTRRFNETNNFVCVKKGPRRVKLHLAPAELECVSQAKF